MHPRFVIARPQRGRGNLAVSGWIMGKLSANSLLPSRDCRVASLLAMTSRRCVPFEQRPELIGSTFPALFCPNFSAHPLCNVQKFPVHRFLPDFSAQALFRTLSFFHSPMCMAARWYLWACGTFAHKFCLRTTNTKNYPTYLLR